MTRRHLTLILAALCPVVLLSAAPPVTPAQARAEPIPQAVLDGWARLIGTWITDNAAYRSEDEPYDAYGLDWSWGLGERTLTGRLYGLRDGKDVGTFWQFREFWHPGEGQLVTMQFSAGGTVGTGPHTLQADGRSEMLQTFYDPAAGTVERVGHRSHFEDGRHVTASFSVEADGTWTPRRTYTWIRQPDR